MRDCPAVLFILAGIFLLIQAVHFSYLLWFAEEASVLDRYVRDPVTEDLKTKSLDELVREYGALHETLEGGKKKHGSDAEWASFAKEEDYIRHHAVKAAIERLEFRVRLASELRYHWLSGLLTGFLGALLMRWVNPVLGAPFLVGGFLLMIFWTHDMPRFSRVGVAESLLPWKLGLTLVTFVLLQAAGYLLRVFDIGGEPAGDQVQ